MAYNRYSHKASSDFKVLETLKKIEKINGTVRTANVEIMDTVNMNGDSVAMYGSALNEGRVPGQKQNYHFSDAGGYPVDYFEDYEIAESINGIVKGKKRPAEELDRITIRMAKLAADNVVEFIHGSAHGNYQWWKDSANENLYETGALVDSIVGVARDKNGKVIGGGR